MTRAGLTLAAVLAAAPALAQAPPPPPGGPAAPAQPGQPGGAHLPVPGSGAPAGAGPGGVPQPAAAPPADPALMAHLTAWERVMQAATNFYCKDVTLVRKNLALKREAAYTGEIMCLKPNMARMRIEKKPAPDQRPDPNDYTAYICTGKEVYEYDGMAKVVTEYKLHNGGVGDNLLLEFMSGALKADDVVQRFDLKLVKQDANYLYLEIKPRLPRDKTEFDAMILVLFQPNLPNLERLAYLPRTVVIRKGNGQEEETWGFPNPAVSVPGISVDHFKFVPVPKEHGWKMQQAQQPSAGGAPGTPAGQPRVARPNGDGP
jgi:TIGR03009 family protein